MKLKNGQNLPIPKNYTSAGNKLKTSIMNDLKLLFIKVQLLKKLIAIKKSFTTSTKMVMNPQQNMIN